MVSLIYCISSKLCGMINWGSQNKLLLVFLDYFVVVSLHEMCILVSNTLLTVTIVVPQSCTKCECCGVKSTSAHSCEEK